MWNVIIGILFIIGGASGEFVLKGTNSSSALVYVGIGLIVWGIIQIVGASSKDDNDKSALEAQVSSGYIILEKRM